MKRILAIALTLLLIAGLSLPAIATGKPSYRVITTLGDSVTAGFRVSETSDFKSEWERCFVTGNYTDFVPYSYPALLGDALGAEAVYNMGISGLTSEQTIKLILEPGYLSPSSANMALLFGGVSDPGEERYHYLLLDTLKQADLITVNIGSNDYMADYALNKLGELALDATTGEIRNQVALLLELVAFSVLMGGFDPSLTDAVLPYMDSFSAEDIAEITAAFSPAQIQADWNEKTEQLKKNTEALLTMLQSETELDAETYSCLKNAYEAADLAAATADDTAEGTELSVKHQLTNGRLTISERDGHYYAAPINPDADVMVIGLYDPWGISYLPDADDWNELTSFFRDISWRLGSALFSRDSAKREQVLVDVINAFALKMPGSLQYLIAGSLSESLFISSNEQLRATAESVGVPFVSVSDMPLHAGVDPHPDVEQHRFIADRILDTLNGTAPVCTLNNKAYASLAEAVAEVKNGDVIRLLTDCNETVTLDRAVSFSFNNSGHSFTGTLTVADGYANKGSGFFYSIKAVPAPTATKPCPTPVIAPAASFPAPAPAPFSPAPVFSPINPVHIDTPAAHSVSIQGPVFFRPFAVWTPFFSPMAVPVKH